MSMKLIQGECLEVMKTLPDSSIDLTVTSPPYDNLRTYNGYVFDFEGIAKELYRVTKTGGVVVWVVGDATIKGSETGTSFKQALYFKDVCGFNLHDTMIYRKKSNYAHDPRNKRYKAIFEYMFIFSKGTPQTYNEIKDNPNNHTTFSRNPVKLFSDSFKIKHIAVIGAEVVVRRRGHGKGNRIIGQGLHNF